MPSLCLRRALCFLVLFTGFLESSFAALLAIDYGSDWIKASLVKPGLPFDVLLNKDSKRKIQSSVAWKRDDRLFGADAANLVRVTSTVNFPEHALKVSRLRAFLQTLSRLLNSFKAHLIVPKLSPTSHRYLPLTLSSPDGQL